MNKRPAPGGASAASPPKKRKTDNVQKFYAVQAGFHPGVYMTYGECSAQTAGFKGAVCEWICYFIYGAFEDARNLEMEPVLTNRLLV